jgi:uncharacterized protein YkwD
VPTSKRRRRRDGTRVRYVPRSRMATAAEPKSEASCSRDAEPVLPTFTDMRYEATQEERVVRLVNDERARAGVPPLRVDARLRKAARAHSADMARRNFCAHECPDGTTPTDRMRTAGYPRPGAENVAKGQRTPHLVMHAWMTSPGHRTNVLNPAFTTIGVGAQLAERCWTQNFGY